MVRSAHVHPLGDGTAFEACMCDEPPNRPRNPAREIGGGGPWWKAALILSPIPLAALGITLAILVG